MTVATITQQPPKPISAPAPPADDIIGKAYDPQVTRRLLTYLQPYRANIVAALAMMAVTMTGFIAGPYLIKVALDGVAARDANALVWAVVLYIVSAIVMWFGTYWRVRIMAVTGQSIIFDLRRE
jgi:ATP-binding cassette subfamily B protein